MHNYYSAIPKLTLIFSILFLASCGGGDGEATTATMTVVLSNCILDESTLDNCLLQ